MDTSVLNFRDLVELEAAFSKGDLVKVGEREREHN
jgi:hypothetical protein